jgi:hypothetical protein
MFFPTIDPATTYLPSGVTYVCERAFDRNALHLLQRDRIDDIDCALPSRIDT